MCTIPLRSNFKIWFVSLRRRCCSAPSTKWETAFILERIAGKAEAFHNFINTDRFVNGRSIRGELGLRGDAFVIGTVAQVVYRKGIDVLIETARILLREHPNLVFLVAGPVSDAEAEFGGRMQSLSSAPDLQGAVRFLGSRADIPDFLSSLDLFVLPTRSEER